MYNFYKNFYNTHILAILISVIALTFAFFLEIFLNLEPCYLCILQRYGYSITLILGILGLIYKYKNIISVLICVSLILTFIITFWHFGIEKHWWLPTLSCSGLDENIGSFSEEMQNGLLNSQSIGCDKISPKFLKLTLVQWSLLYIFINTLFIILLTIKQLSKKQPHEN